MSSAHPSVHCLVAVARHYGLGASADSLCEEHGIYSDAPTIPQLIAMARGLAMRAQARRLNWRELAKLDGVFPLIAKLQDGTASLGALYQRNGLAVALALAGGFSLFLLPCHAGRGMTQPPRCSHNGSPRSTASAMW